MSQTTLKIIAITTMLIDHIGAVILLPMAAQGDFVELYWTTRYIGRMAFPIFAYLIAVGCVYTKNINFYALRLGVFALISQIPFSLALGSEINFASHTNIFYTLFLAVVAIKIYKMFQKGDKSRYFAALVALPPAAFLAHFLGADFGAFGVLLIFFIYMFNPLNKLHAAGVVASFMVYRHFLHNPLFLTFGILAAVCIYFNNQMRKPQSPILKHFFYMFYPLHLAILALFVTIM